MTFNPHPGDRIQLSDHPIEFNAIPGTSFTYAEIGREATVYKVTYKKKFHALKVFHPLYRNVNSTNNLRCLNSLKGVPALRIADRIVLGREKHSKIVDFYPELENAVLMPWIEGDLWCNLSLKEPYFEFQHNYSIALSLAKAFQEFEYRGLAHCDLSSSNFLIRSDGGAIELIDIDRMYAPDLAKPQPDVSYGTEGYRNSWVARKGAWGPQADRFALSILCAEILCWGEAEIRAGKYGESAYFSEAEIGTKSSRYLKVGNYLRVINPVLSGFFEQAWWSDNLTDCPSAADWVNGLVNLHQREKERTEEVRSLLSPPKLKISTNLLEFGPSQNNTIKRPLLLVNKGEMELTGHLVLKEWLSAAARDFTIPANSSIEFQVEINPSKIPGGKDKEYRSVSAIIIESNGGTEVVGVTYNPLLK